MSKYKIPVSIITCASHVIGQVECDSVEEYERKAEELWESQGYDSPATNITNNFDLGDWGLDELEENDLHFYSKD